MEPENRDVGGVEWEARLGKRALERLTVEASSQMRFGLPDADDVKSVLIKGAMMPKLARWAAPVHDEPMRIVVGLLQPLDVAVEAFDQHDVHDHSLDWSRSPRQ